ASLRVTGNARDHARDYLRFACSGTHGITFALRARCSLEGEASLRVTGNARDHARDYLRSA
ncbi:MAG: hypothetical protein WC056_06200, partial [Bacteroidales bacterium]